MNRSRPLAATLAVAALLLAACGYDATPVPKPKAADATTASSSKPVQCDNPTQSYAPSNDRAKAVADLKHKGRLVVGVSGDTFQMGFSDPTDGELKGFDIDFAKAIAKALGVTLDLRVISAADRTELLKNGTIDMVARNMTVNCERWEQVAFSSVYYNATQKVLVRKDQAASYRGPESLAGKKVCAPTATTSLTRIDEVAPAADPIGAKNHTGCLILFQKGDVDAITGDDTVLAGLAAQDPYAVVPPQQTKLSDEPYGLAFDKNAVDLVRYANTVLQEMRTDGAWQKAYTTWLKPYLKVDTAPPAPVYGR
ncbi:glutamate ABC transporter substrate-binding protein [Pimelobacter simplex]|uniref:glutamate ABC transporter substrate-binding protein n=1 Tax=Nocardioides simplex TaxID=2045 RepID=UPI003AAAC795